MIIVFKSNCFKNNKELEDVLIIVLSCPFSNSSLSSIVMMKGTNVLTSKWSSRPCLEYLYSAKETPALLKSKSILASLF